MEVEAMGCATGAATAGGKRGRAKAAGPGGDAEPPPEAKRRALAVGVPVPSPSPGGAGTTTPAWAAQQQQQHPASRIYRVSRASGGKDRHSKVYTSRGIRDRRVRLSVATAIQFYDLQDRLGYDQPSKAIEWLIRAAADAIDRLPSLDAAAGFPAHPASAAAPAAAKDHRATPVADDDDGGGGGGAGHHHNHNHQGTSGCSSTSETSKGSVLSLSRSDSRVKARERARERSAVAVARDKDKDPSAAAAANDATTTARRAAGTTASAQAAGTTASAQAASFTELLTGMAAAAASAAAPAEHNKHQHQHQQSSLSWQHPATVSATTDYIGFAQPPRKGAAGHAMAHAFASPAPHLGNIASIAMAPAAQHFGLATGAVTVASGGGGGEPHTEMTHFSFLQDHFMPVHAAPAPAPAPAGEYNLNFSMSSGLVGVNSRGTLQSNSSQPHISGHHHHHHHQQLQRLSTPLDAPNIPFLFSPAAAAAAAVTTPTTAEGQFAAFQLWNGFHHADMKEKGKN